MWLSAQILGCLALLFFGGDLLVRGAVALALRLGVSPLAVGLTVVAVGTSLPELVVSVDAALSGANDISLGNVVGSNICNIGLILGLAALARPLPVSAGILGRDAPLLVLVSFALVAMLGFGGVSRLQGALLVLGTAAYTIWTLWSARAESSTDADVPELDVAVAADPVWKSVGYVTGGLALLVAGAHWLVPAAILVAQRLGVSEAAIGLTIVAVGTSLPELMTSVVAAWKGEGDIAIGNVVGSNLFNILGVLGFTAAVEPLVLGDLSPVDLGVMAGLAVVLFGMMWTGRRVGRLEGGALLGAYVLHTSYLLAM